MGGANARPTLYSYRILNMKQGVKTTKADKQQGREPRTSKKHTPNQSESQGQSFY